MTNSTCCGPTEPAIVVILGSVMSVLDTTVVNIALEPGTWPAARAAILDRFHVRYLLVNTKTTPRAVAALSADPGLREVFRYGDWAAFAQRR